MTTALTLALIRVCQERLTLAESKDRLWSDHSTSMQQEEACPLKFKHVRITIQLCNSREVASPCRIEKEETEAVIEARLGLAKSFGAAKTITHEEAASSVVPR